MQSEWTCSFVWLLLLNTVCELHKDVVCGRHSCIFIIIEYSIQWLYHHLKIIQMTFVGHLDCFHFNLDTHIWVNTVEVPLGWYPRKILLGPMIYLSPTLLDNAGCLTKYLYHLHSHQQCIGFPFVAHPHQPLVL